MKTIAINGVETQMSVAGMPRLIDVVELIKSSIDPEHMITGIFINGSELTDEDWNAPTTQFSDAVLEVLTGEPEAFVKDRLNCAPDVVQACYLEFRSARKLFRDGKMDDGNRQLVQAVNTLQAFFQWYASMIEIVPEADRNKYLIEKEIATVSEVCKKICQQQLYQSWWALGETLESELEPALDEVEDRCREFVIQ